MEGSNSSNPMEQALGNPIILQQILQNGDIKAKKMRLVCKQWNEIVLTLPEPKLQLNLNAQRNNCCCDSHQFQLFCSDMEPNLARSISLSDWCYRDHPRSTAVVANGAMLIHVCDKFGEVIQFLDLNVGDDLIYKVLQKINYCPNLKDLIIREYEGELLNPEPLPTRSKLVSIYLDVGEQIVINISSSLGQLLINSAPNLETLELSSEGYFPDLSSAGKLRVLRIPRGPTLRRVRFEEFFQMLEQVAEKLEVLWIGCKDSNHKTHFECDGVGADVMHHFQFPRMARLKSFMNEYVDILTCGDALQSLCSERCPALRSLYLAHAASSEENYNIDPLLRRVIENKTRINASSMILIGVNDQSLISNLKTSFPQLDRLELHGMGSGIVEGSYIELGASLKACTSLGLSHLGLELFTYPDTFSEFLGCFLDNWRLFRTLKTFWVDSPFLEDRPYIEDKSICKETPEGWNLMKQFLLTLGAMKSAVLYPPFKEDAWWERIRQFIEEHNIPVEFKDF